MRRFTILFAVTSLAAVAAADAWADVTISTDQTQNMNCSGGICSPTATVAVLNVNDLESMLAAGDLTVTTTGGSIQANNIGIATGVSWSATTTLIVDAYDSVDINALVSVAGPGNLTLKFRDGGQKGGLAYNGGSITFASLSSVLTMNRKVYTLVGDIKTLASDIQAKSTGKFALAAPYDASQDGTYSTVPIPTQFVGSFDGLGNTISNLSIDDPTEQFVGLFAHLLKGGNIANLNLTDVNINGSYNPMANAIDLGAVVGESRGTLSHVSVTGTVTDSLSDNESGVIGGGLVGGNEEGIIAHCTSAVAVSAGELDLAYLGGLAGQSGGGKISDSVASGTVTESSSSRGSVSVGGAVGDNSSLIERSHADGNVTAGSGAYVGGLVGGDSGWITTSYATGSVNGGTAGGLVGAAGVYQSDTISESFATGSVTGYWGGGLVGSLSGSATNSYADGEVEASVAGGFAGVVSSGSVSDSYAIGNVPGKKYSYRGGFAGEDLTSAGMKASYWDTDTSGRRNGTGNRGNEPGIKGLTTTQLQSGLPKGFGTKVWTETAGVNNGLPYLIKNPPPQ